MTTARDATLDRLVADPSLVMALLAPDLFEAEAERRRIEAAAPGGVGIVARVLRLFRTPSAPPDRSAVRMAVDTTTEEAPPPAREILGLTPTEGISRDLDKAWHGLHWLLNGRAWDGEPPLDFLVQGGEEVGDDLGYGPARAFRSRQVQAIDRALATVSDDDLRSRFDPPAMEAAEIYPSIWEDDAREAFDYLVHAYDDLRGFVRASRDAGTGFVIQLL